MSSPPFLSTRLQSALIEGLDNIQELLTVGLTTADHRAGRQPRLAEAVPTLENGLWRLSPDGRMETTWRIRPGAVWHDGTPFTSRDALFTAALDQDPELGFPANLAYGFIESVEAPGPGTVTVTWKQPYIRADSHFSGFLAPAHLLERAYLEEKNRLTSLPYWTEEFVGTGPYRLREWAAGSHVVLQAFDQYVLGRPKVDLIEVKFIPDHNALIANILAGVVEVTLGKSLTLEQARQVVERWPEGRIDLSPANAISIYPQFVNPNPPVVAEVRFRRALFHALDRQEMADTILGGVTTVVHSYLSSNEPPEYHAAQNRVVRYDYDLRRAAQLMGELGYAKGADGFYRLDSSGRSDASGRDPAGQRLQIEIRTTVNDIQEKAMYASADYWQRLGVAVDPIIIPRSLAQDREYRANYPAFEEVRNPNDFGALARVHGSQAPLPQNNFRGNNRTRYMNLEFDALIDRFHATIPLRERVEIVRQIVHHMTDQVIVMGLFYDAESIVMSKELQSITAVPPGTQHTWNAHEWEVS